MDIPTDFDFIGGAILGDKPISNFRYHGGSLNS